MSRKNLVSMAKMHRKYRVSMVNEAGNMEIYKSFAKNDSSLGIRNKLFEYIGGGKNGN